MYLKSLTLRGFKSFASATTLNFEPGITCVVGPNGSGKSNVVDALSWVMGEQGAKSLRGGKMEDVIFAGTSGRSPLGRAEVSLTIDNTDGALPIEYTEVTITRTMFRNGGSDYSINGHSARLLDVQELLSDSGIGREMHVIVGQGQLDTILQATPEIRRGFIEEAAGVLKHRKRKEKALRKLDSTQGNLDRLQDLVAEIRRQLKPLGRQAAVARKAAVIQAELRDAKARLLADDLTQATLALETDLADEKALNDARARAEARLEAAREAELAAELVVAQAQPRLNRAQDTWYALAALRERVMTTQQIAAERMRHADAQPELGRPGRDPEQLERDAETARTEENELRQEVDALTQKLANAQLRRTAAEKAHAEADKAHAAQLRAIADRREGLARLTGQVNSLKSRLDASSEEAERLTAQRDEALARAEKAAAELAEAQQRADAHQGDGGELVAAQQRATEKVSALGQTVQELRRTEQQAQQERAGLAARIEALEMGLDRTDAPAALLAARDRLGGVLGQLAELLGIESGWETAIAAALGTATEAIAVDSLDAAEDALTHLKEGDLGRAGLLLAGATRSGTTEIPDGLHSALDVITVAQPLLPALERLLGHVVLVEDIEQATAVARQNPDLSAVTREGDVVSAWFVTGGSASKSSLLEIQAAVDTARSGLDDAVAAIGELQRRIKEQDRLLEAANAERIAVRQAVKESEREASDLNRQVSVLAQAEKSARGEAERLERSIATAQATRAKDEAGLAELEERLARASDEQDIAEPDSYERDRHADEARRARTDEMDARLALRTAEERVRALAGRADSLRRAALAERQAREKAAARAAQLRREAEAATAVHAAAGWLLTRVDASRALATTERNDAEAARVSAEGALGVARRETRELAKEVEKLVEGAHRDEMARIEVKMRIESLAERAMSELGIEAEILMREYGPDQFVPVITRPDGTALDEDDEVPEPIPFVREQQAKRLRAAERNLQVLGRVNPLALEEFDAMQERHAFLAEQLEDLRQTRKDLMDIVDEVDRRVEEVFAQAYEDVEKTFNDVFPRLFPGGEGRLVLTEPGQWLTTGVDVEARPAGKKVKRLSLLSGGERSLVAVAFLVSLFIARPSPFYILDEVEAALDDANLGRLLGIYEQLRENSQLLVITHQKRTMEIADALYGVTMRGDGVSTVISQRLHHEE
ncbi:chromosome segregation protein SMC [Luteococcus japonicus]|uniref:Chromosome partition protein Smc n=1 Tax=Luteococcus japonicus LSP_Lj1 TaxID=1255658 RepID=A0A1R4JDB0_9ACTN|nr:chromosome segregation protein SMC [Luteococcus japonicus]SJN30017.1 Chromosome partition protein smc [Luteococcus japonicus LSP_Lj1]